MMEKYLPRQERSRLLLPEPSQQLIPLQESDDFFELVHGPFNEDVKKYLSIFHESEGRQWLESLTGTEGTLQYRQQKSNKWSSCSGVVREVIATEAYFGKVNNHKTPDFLVLTEDNGVFKVAAYEVKSGTGGLQPDTEKQISQENTVKVLDNSPPIVKRIKNITHGRSPFIVNGSVLLPRSLRNKALLQPLDSFPKNNGQYILPKLETYPYAIAQYSSSRMSEWKLGKNVQFFPSHTYPPDDLPEIETTAAAFGISPTLLDRKVFFSKKISVNHRMARVSNLEFGSDITVGIPYSGWEVLQIVTKAAKVLQQKDLDIARPYSEFLREFHNDLSFFSFMKALNSEQNRFASNSKNGRVVYANGNGTQADYL